LLTVAGLHVPGTALSDVVGNVGTPAPEHMVMEFPKLNVGIVFGVIVTLKLADVAHWPAFGVKVYTPEFWLSTVAGLHVPVMPFEELVGNEGTLAPAQTVREVPKLNVGVILGLTVTVKLAEVAHWPAFGVNVYTPEFWLSIVAGLHVPLMLLVEVLGRVGTDPPLHIDMDVPNVKVGVTLGLTVTFLVIGIPHDPDEGVNV
jgi:hypothetical protein